MTMTNPSPDAQSNGVAATPTRPTNPLVTPLLTDLYQITMTYAHWKIGKHSDPAVFELFFRKNPFKGQFTIFCGLDECLKHLSTFQFSADEVNYLRSLPSLSHCEEGFFEYLLQLDTSELHVSALQEGSIVFPRVPMIMIQAPLGLGQLLETTLLNLVNYPSLIATNAARMVLRAQSIPCVEFGLRRAQGPDGACSASKYSFIGGFVGTSNVQAGKLNSMTVWGTHAHAYVQSFASLDGIEALTLAHATTGEQVALLPKVLEYREKDPGNTVTNDGELAAFVAYACAFPDKFLCLVDTYDTLKSGLLNYCYVALALIEMGYHPRGIRLDSGDLVALSLACKDKFQQLAASAGSNDVNKAIWETQMIAASNDINEKVLHDLSNKSHGMNAFGIGTNLVTCQAQPALGCVYKLVECQGQPRIKLSQELVKVTLPGRKRVYRILQETSDSDGRNEPCDVMTLAHEPMPQSGQALECFDPSMLGQESTIVTVTPSTVIELHSNVFEKGKVIKPVASIIESQQFVKEQLKTLPDKVTQYEDPRIYRVYISKALHQYLRDLWEKLKPKESM